MLVWMSQSMYVCMRAMVDTWTCVLGVPRSGHFKVLKLVVTALCKGAQAREVAGAAVSDDISVTHH